MKDGYDLSHLEKEWSQRNFDLFPYVEGLFSLMRSREGNLEKTESRLRRSSAATIVQFLGSDDKDVSLIAKRLIQEHQDQPLITAILLYSLTKVTKRGYAGRVGDCLAGCLQPAPGLGYFFQFLRQFPEIKARGQEFFQHFWLTGTESLMSETEPIESGAESIVIETEPIESGVESIVSADPVETFFGALFQAIREDLEKSIPCLEEISSLPELLLLKEDLAPALRVYYLVETRAEIRMIFDQGLREFGQHIRSLHKLISFESHTYLKEVLPVVIAFIGLLRLENDRRHLDRILSKIAESDYTKPLATHLEILLERVISLLEDPTKYAYENLPHDLFF